MLDCRDIHPSVDVFTADGVYLGTVLRVESQTRNAPTRVMVQTRQQPSAVSGELLGPMPTQTIGNPRPRTQSADQAFGAQPDGATPLGGAFVIGKWWGLVGRRRLPLDAVQTVSLERVVLPLRHDALEADGDSHL